MILIKKKKSTVIVGSPSSFNKTQDIFFYKYKLLDKKECM